MALLNTTSEKYARVVVSKRDEYKFDHLIVESGDPDSSIININQLVTLHLVK